MKQSFKQVKCIKSIKRNKLFVLITQILISLLFITLWELLSKYKIINPFIFSSPSRILKTILNLFKNNNLIYHIWVTSYETIISFLITTFLSLLISIVLYRSVFLSKVFDPYLTMLNSLPKVALGPIIIIWVGANIKSIILMSVFI